MSYGVLQIVGEDQQKGGIATIYSKHIWRLVDYRVVHTSVALACQLENLETHDRVVVVNVYMPPVGSAALKRSVHSLQSGEKSMRADFLCLID